MVGNSQRAAWNQAMGLPSNQGLVKKRLRREKKVSIASQRSTGESNTQDIEYPNIIRLDRLERGGQVNFPVEDDGDGDDIGFYSTGLSKQQNDDDDEYDDLEELDNEESTKKKRKSKQTQGGKGGKGKTKDVGRSKAASIPKWMKPRSMASILIEESGRTSRDGVLRQYIAAEARPTDMIVYPKRKFCPVTGLLGLYVDPKTGIPFASLSALEQIRERSPPWMSGSGGSALYHETVNSLRNAMDS